MKKIIWSIRIIIICALLIILMPFLGFPLAWEMTFFVILGLVILGACLVANKKASEYFVMEQKLAEEETIKNKEINR